jgi:hypothetical protein
MLASANNSRKLSPWSPKKKKKKTQQSAPISSKNSETFFYWKKRNKKVNSRAYTHTQTPTSLFQNPASSKCEFSCCLQGSSMKNPPQNFFFNRKPQKQKKNILNSKMSTSLEGLR